MHDDLERQKRANALRKEQHPGWPTHRSILYPPRQPPRVISECVPVGRYENYSGHCKYCYRTHKDWWLMDSEDYGEGTMLLCGHCEHTSEKERS